MRRLEQALLVIDGASEGLGMLVISTGKRECSKACSAALNRLDALVNKQGQDIRILR